MDEGLSELLVINGHFAAAPAVVSAQELAQGPVPSAAVWGEPGAPTTARCCPGACWAGAGAPRSRAGGGRPGAGRECPSANLRKKHEGPAGVACARGRDRARWQVAGKGRSSQTRPWDAAHPKERVRSRPRGRAQQCWTRRGSWVRDSARPHGAGPPGEGGGDAPRPPEPHLCVKRFGPAGRGRTGTSVCGRRPRAHLMEFAEKHICVQIKMHQINTVRRDWVRVLRSD